MSNLKDKIEAIALTLEINKHRTAVMRFVNVIVHQDTENGYALVKEESTLNSVEECLSGRGDYEFFLGEYWSSLSDYLNGNLVKCAGEIKKNQLRELGLHDPKKSIIKIYSDGVYFPIKE